MPAAARAGDNHRCYQQCPVPHKGGGIFTGCKTVLIGEAPAARVGDKAFCQGGSADVIIAGKRTVLIGGKPAARLGDATNGGHVSTGLTTVQIGSHPLIAALREAADAGVPFCARVVHATGR